MRAAESKWWRIMLLSSITKYSQVRNFPYVYWGKYRWKLEKCTLNIFLTISMKTFLFLHHRPQQGKYYFFIYFTFEKFLRMKLSAAKHFDDAVLYNLNVKVANILILSKYNFIIGFLLLDNTAWWKFRCKLVIQITR